MTTLTALVDPTPLMPGAGARIRVLDPAPTATPCLTMMVMAGDVALPLGRGFRRLPL